MNLMKKSVAALLCAMIVFAPALAQARAGASTSRSGGSTYSSQGSRGSQTYENNGAAPIQRSITPTTPSPAAPGYQTPGYGAPGYAAQPSFFQRHPFMAGIAGGIAGSWLGGMLFGHSGYAGDGMGSSSGSMFGGLFQIILIGLLIWFVVRLFRRRGGFSSFMPGAATAPSYFGTTAASPRETTLLASRSAMPPLQLSEGDFNEFTSVLSNVQSAWSAGDLAALRRGCTPEMLSYFAEELAGNESRGVVNKVENVTLLEGEPRESWSEGNAEYATAYLRWSANDYTVRTDVPPGTTAIVSGDASHPVEAAEVWTFMRSPGGHWLLSAIQQV